MRAARMKVALAVVGMTAASVVTSTIARSQPAAAATTTTTEQAAANWAKAQTGSTAWEYQCLAFVYQAYISAGMSRATIDSQAGYVATSSTYPIDEWNYWISGHLPAGQLHQGYDASPPVGAIIYFSNKLGRESSHTTISIGGGMQVSPDPTGVSGPQSVNTNSYRTMLGWWLPDGASAGTTASSAYAGHIVQWDGDTNAQKTAWLVGLDGRRTWIPSSSIFNCLKSFAAPGPDVLSSSVLSSLPDQTGVSATCDKLSVNWVMSRGQTLYATANGYYLAFQASDGNLVVYQGSRALWATYAGSAVKLVMQSDGNLVEYDSAGRAVWSSGTAGNGYSQLIMQGDGNLVVYSAARATWATATAGGTNRLGNPAGFKL